jgi:hypothetical protein
LFKLAEDLRVLEQHHEATVIAAALQPAINLFAMRESQVLADEHIRLGNTVQEIRKHFEAHVAEDAIRLIVWGRRRWTQTLVDEIMSRVQAVLIDIQYGMEDMPDWLPEDLKFEIRLMRIIGWRVRLIYATGPITWA